MTGAERIRAWLTDQALPLWAEAGVDREGGGFVERLHLDGRPDFTAAKRVRVQARQIYVYSHAQILGLWPNGAGLAMRAFEFLMGHARLADGCFAHLLDYRGRIVDNKRDTYDHAFVLNAFAWLYRATQETKVALAIDETVRALDVALAHPSGEGYREDDKDSLPRRQNPHMHLLEAFLALHTATGDARYLARASAMADLFRTRFFEARARVLREFFNADWSVAAGEPGRIIEPGHHYEWVWLLHQLAQALGGVPPREIEALAEFADAHGCEAATGLVYDEVWDDGRVKRATKRSWPQTEALKAELALAEVSHKGITTPKADKILNSLFAYYLVQKVPGGWNDVVDAANLPIATHMPASTFYHVFLAFAEYLRIAELKPQAQRS
jgi:mannose/cellobiose epimerase-like protein (N-acyl-D-glucosamine 2-epimerase family)